MRWVMGEGGCMSVVGEEWGLCVWWEKGEGKRKKKKIEREKTKLVLFICLLCFVWCKV